MANPLQCPSHPKRLDTFFSSLPRQFCHFKFISVDYSGPCFSQPTKLLESSNSSSCSIQFRIFAQQALIDQFGLTQLDVPSTIIPQYPFASTATQIPQISVCVNQKDRVLLLQCSTPPRGSHFGLHLFGPAGTSSGCAVGGGRAVSTGKESSQEPPLYSRNIQQNLLYSRTSTIQQKFSTQSF